ncbi:hypothetical protein J6590_004051 [Homalodisca vitripennis]|nr:hypothetical protein J6590_004051 [Homalodisca vitripennis]
MREVASHIACLPRTLTPSPSPQLQQTPSHVPLITGAVLPLPNYRPYSVLSLAN